MKKLINTESCRLLTHKRARMIKLATGVALMACSGNSMSAASIRWLRANAASKKAPSTAKPKPARMRSALKITRAQKAGCGSMAKKQRSASSGVTNNIFWPITRAAICHTASQNKRAKARSWFGKSGRTLFFIFSVPQSAS